MINYKLITITKSKIHNNILIIFSIKYFINEINIKKIFLHIIFFLVYFI